MASSGGGQWKDSSSAVGTSPYQGLAIGRILLFRLRATKVTKLHRFPLQALATLVWAYGQLGHFDDDLFEVLAIRSLALLPSRPRKISEDPSPSSTQPDSSQVTLLPVHLISVPESVGAHEEGGNGTVNWEVVPHAEAPHPPLDHYSSWTPRTFSMMALAYSRNNCVQTPACRSLMTAIADEALLQVNAFDCQV